MVRQTPTTKAIKAGNFSLGAALHSADRGSKFIIGSSISFFLYIPQTGSVLPFLREIPRFFSSGPLLIGRGNATTVGQGRTGAQAGGKRHLKKGHHFDGELKGCFRLVWAHCLAGGSFFQGSRAMLTRSGSANV